MRFASRFDLLELRVPASKHRVLFFYDVYAFTNEELWYGVQWKDLTCSELRLDEMLQLDGHEALLEAYRKPSIPWHESHGYSISHGRLRFDATTAKHLDDVRRRRRSKPTRRVVHSRSTSLAAAASPISKSPSPMDLGSDSDSDSSIDDDAPLSTLVESIE